MKVDVLPFGLYQSNCYILHDNGHVLIIDPSRFPKEIFSCVSDDETVDAVLLTHGHEDHTAAADDVAEHYSCDVYMNLKDYPLVDPSNGQNFGYGSPVYHEIKDLKGDMKVGPFDLTVYETPGHTAGSVCIRYRNLLFSGDTLFRRSIGRTDLYSGNDREMLQSLQFLKTLPHDLKVLPGHEGTTTIKDEIERNPYMNGYFGYNL